MEVGNDCGSAVPVAERTSDKVPLFNFPRQTLLFTILSILYYIECSADNFPGKLSS